MPSNQHNTDAVSLELFIVSLGENNLVHYVRKEVVKDTRNPDHIVQSLLQKRDGNDSTPIFNPVIVHSTSWRHQDNGMVVLTYLAFIEQCHPKTLDMETFKSIPMNNIPISDEINLQFPRPSTIREEDVLAHGLRHLAFLARRDESGKFSQILNKRSKDFFWSIAPAISGQLN